MLQLGVKNAVDKVFVGGHNRRRQRRRIPCNYCGAVTTGVKVELLVGLLS